MVYEKKVESGGMYVLLQFNAVKNIGYDLHLREG